MAKRDACRTKKGAIVIIQALQSLVEKSAVALFIVDGTHVALVPEQLARAQEHTSHPADPVRRAGLGSPSDAGPAYVDHKDLCWKRPERQKLYC